MRRNVLTALTALALTLGVANVLAADRVILGNTRAIPLAASADIGIAQTLSALRQQAASRGTMRVIVGVRAAFAPEGLIAADSAAQQRDEIATTQSAVLNRVPSLKQRPETTKRFETIPFMAMEVTPAELETLAGLTEITSIEEDRLAAPHLAQSVPLIGGTAAWASGYTGTGQTVAILDTGVDGTHPFLAGKVVSEACYSSSSGLLFGSISPLCPGGVTSSTAAGSAMPYASGVCPTGECDHGTHVAGIAAGNGAGAGVSFSGVAKDASVIAIQIFSRIDGVIACRGSSTCVSSFDSDIIRGLERVYALRTTYNIAAVNMSLGGGSYSDQSTCDSDNTSTKAAIDNLRAANIATVISSGNDGNTSSVSAPGCISSAISVGATWDVAGQPNSCSGNNLGTSSVDAIACYSNSASFLNLLAPGSLITSSIPGGSFATWQGTSMAAPHATGAWALLKQKSASITVTAAFNNLNFTGLLVTDPRNGIPKPRIWIDSALAAIGGTLPPDCLFNWAEKTYPTLFAPAGATSTTLAPYYYRYYSQTNAYLGTSYADNHVYYRGPLSNNSIVDEGPMSGWLTTAGCQ
jgi:subtilisin family serine protease